MMLVYGMAEFLSTFIEGFIAYLVTVQPCDWQKRETEKVFSSDYPHGNT